MRQVEVAIIGGGPAGAATAAGLAALGREVLLVERAGGPRHKVCGEFLSLETQTQLLRLGVDASALGAVPIERVAVYAARRSVTAALPFRGLSLSRYRLDEALVRCAERRGAEVKRSAAVRSVRPDAGGWIAACDDGDAIRCRQLVLATGKKTVRGLSDARNDALVGLKMHLRLADGVRRALEGRVELSLLAGGYIGLEPVEDGIANLCLVLPRALAARLGPGWAALRGHLAAALPALGERLDGAVPLWEKPLAAVCPAGGYLHREPDPAVYRVGDRLAHIPPFTGDGLAIALASAALAVEHIRLDRPPAAYLAAARRLTGRGIRLASIVSGLAQWRGGRTALLGAAACAPRLIGAIVRRTRVPLIARGP